MGRPPAYAILALAAAATLGSGVFARGKRAPLSITIESVNFQSEGGGEFQAVVGGKDAEGRQLMTPLVAPTLGISSSAAIAEGTVVFCKALGKELACRAIGE